MKKTTKTTTDPEPTGPSRTSGSNDETYPVTRDEARLMAWSLRQAHAKLRDFEYWMISLNMSDRKVFDDALELAAKLETFARS